MGKYFQLLKITFEEYFVYRFNFFLWRFRSFVFFFTLFFFWLAVYKEKEVLFGYQKPQMLSYLVGVAFLRAIVFGSRSVDEAVSGIRSGSIARWLITPIDFFKSLFFRDLADKILNLIFCLFEISFVLSIFHFPFYFPKNPVSLLLFVLVCIFSIFLYFYLLLFFAAFAFWTDQVWALRWLGTIILLQFLSGEVFPLDIFPSWLFKITQLTPFPYLVYFPLKIWLEKMNSIEILRVLLIMTVWLIISQKVVKFLWQKGLKEYSVYGG